MKFFGAIVLLTLILSGQNYSQVTGLGNTDPRVFTRYKLPATTVKQFNISGNTQLTSLRWSVPGMTEQTSAYRINLISNYSYLKESDDTVFSFGGYLSGGLSSTIREHNHIVNSDKSSDNYENMSLSVTPSLLLYPASDGNLFYNLNAAIRTDMYNSKTKFNNSTEAEKYRSSGSKYQNYTAEAGIGWGRIRNVSPVVNAIRFQERLKVLNKINSDLSEDDILALSSQFSRFGDYTSIFDRPAKYFYKDLDNVLSSRNISLNDLNLYSAAYLMETVSELRFTRFEGFMTGLSLMLNYDNDYDVYEDQPNPRTSILMENLISGLHFFTAFSHQLDLYSQFSVRLDVSGGPNVLAHPVTRQVYNVALTPAYSRELTDRFTFTASNAMSYNIRNAGYEYISILNDLSLRFTYFIEDNISLNAEYTWIFDESTVKLNSLPGQNPGDLKNVRSSHAIWMGVTYALHNSLNLN